MYHECAETITGCGESHPVFQGSLIHMLRDSITESAQVEQVYLPSSDLQSHRLLR